jgi:uncharacterized membrane protein
MKVAKSRSLVKALTWRVVAVIVTFLCIYALTGEVDIAGAGTVLTNSINFVLYYFHERAWNAVGWGRIKEKESGTIKP